MHAATELIRASVRPLVTVGVVGAYCAACLRSDDAIEGLRELVFAVTAFWFAGRKNA